MGAYSINKKKKLIIIGDSSFAEIAYEYFNFDSEFEVIAFSVEKDYLNKKTLFHLPILPFESLDKIFNPVEYYIFVAIAYRKLNRVRKRVYFQAKEKGFKIASYISSYSFVWQNVKIGDNVFIFENNVIQPFVKIGNNVIIWSGNHIGHHSTIDNNCFISSHVVISGHCKIGENCFLGVNSTVVNNVEVANDNFIAAGTLVTSNTEKGKIYKGNPFRAANIDVYKKFGINSDEMD